MSSRLRVLTLPLLILITSCSSGTSIAGSPEVGLLRDGFFVATEQEIAALNLDERPLDANLPSMEWKNMDSVKLGTLEARLTGVDYEDIEQASLHNTFYVADEVEGPWYFTVRPELQDALSRLTREQAQSIARDWMATEEWQGQYPSGVQDADVAEVTSLLISLGELASEAQRRHATLFVVQGQ